jgi:hypothetical protein
MPAFAGLLANVSYIGLGHCVVCRTDVFQTSMIYCPGQLDGCWRQHVIDSLHGIDVRRGFGGTAVKLSSAELENLQQAHVPVPFPRLSRYMR